MESRRSPRWLQVRSPDAVRALAVFEAAKGALVLAIATGLLSLHRDLEPLAAQLLSHLHFDPASRSPRIFADVAAAMTDGRLRLLAVGAVGYALLRFVEAYGLWQGKRWAEWLAAITAAIYILCSAETRSGGEWSTGVGTALNRYLSDAIRPLSRHRLHVLRHRCEPVLVMQLAQH